MFLTNRPIWHLDIEGLFLNGAKDEGMAKLSVLNQILQAQATEQIKAEPYERNTNGLERLNEEIRRRERVIRIFPNRESAIRLIGALLMEQDEKWTSGKKYLDMVEYFEWQKENSKK